MKATEERKGLPALMLRLTALFAQAREEDRECQQESCIAEGLDRDERRYLRLTRIRYRAGEIRQKPEKGRHGPRSCVCGHIPEDVEDRAEQCGE